jgi:hypothetical protein
MPIKTETLSLFDENPDLILKYWEDYPQYKNGKPIKECYAIFYRDVYKQDKNFYFAFPGLPLWYKDLIEEFNSKFNSIKYEILAEKDVYLHYKKDYYGITLECSDTPRTFSESYHVKVPLLTIKLSDKYNQNANKYLYYFFHHFIRVNSFIENYIKQEEFNNPPKEKFIEYTLDHSNKGFKYRSLSEEDISEKELLKFDDVDKVNKAFKGIDGHQTQTDIYWLLNENKYNFYTGQLVLAPIDYDYRGGDTKKMVLCTITRIHRKGVYIRRVNCARRYHYNFELFANFGTIVEFNPEIKNSAGKFKIGDQVTSKLTAKYSTYIPWGIIIENYMHNLCKIKTDDKEYVVDENSYKLIPKMQRREVKNDSFMSKVQAA